MIPGCILRIWEEAQSTTRSPALSPVYPQHQMLTNMKYQTPQAPRGITHQDPAEPGVMEPPPVPEIRASEPMGSRQLAKHIEIEQCVSAATFAEIRERAKESAIAGGRLDQDRMIGSQSALPPNNFIAADTTVL